MGYNKINRVSQKAFDTLTKLRVLWLDNNQIRSLPDDIFYNCEYLEQINLGANQETVQIVKFIKTGFTTLHLVIMPLFTVFILQYY